MIENEGYEWNIKATPFDLKMIATVFSASLSNSLYLNFGCVHFENGQSIIFGFDLWNRLPPEWLFKCITNSNQ